MKKILILVIALLAVACTDPNRMIGDEFIVTAVNYYPHPIYETNYRVTLHSAHLNADWDTWGGNYVEYFTDVLYCVGDTLTFNGNSLAVKH